MDKRKARVIPINTVNPYLWAKKKEVNGQFLWLPLKQHLEDTRLVIDRLWEQWLNTSQKRLIVESLSIQNETVAKNLALFLAATHDLGKATPVFQRQEGYSSSRDLDLELLERLERQGFRGIMSANIPSPKLSPHALASQVMLSWYGVREDIGSIIGGHHGRPIDSSNTYRKQNSYLENYFQHEKADQTAHIKWKQVQNEFFHWALESSGFTSVEDLPQISQPGQVILTGLLIMADWIASNEEYFPLIPLEQLVGEASEDRLMSAWTKWYRTLPIAISSNQTSENLYKNRFGFEETRSVQVAFTKAIDQTDQPGIFILEAPMGVGKTEAALVGVEQLMQKTGRSGMFFGLPTQATSDGIFPRINKWLESIGKQFHEDIQIRLHHGKANLNEYFRGIAREVDIDGTGNGSVFVNEWFSGRKTASLDDFVIGTVDQVLLMGLKQKHVALRHLGFSKKVVVIDEVHSYDAFMSVYLNSALRWLGAYGVPVIILSATLASGIRKELIKSYMLGQGYKISKEIQYKDMFTTDTYPLITYTDGEQIQQIEPLYDDNTKEVSIKKIKEEELHPLIYQLAQQDGVIGIVVNTVRRAQELARYCVEAFGEDSVELLHSSFIATDRIQKEKELLEMIGKGAKRPKRKIIIGTQVIEQSLDINFDTLISDLAPMDLLIQRLGRLHRHEIEYPEHHSQPVFYVVGTNADLEFEAGSSIVYGDYLLARTQHYLPDTIVLPNDISPLVQKVYSEDEIVWPEGLLQKYETMRNEHQKKIDKKKTKASAFKLNNPKNRIRTSYNLIGWLNALPAEGSEEAVVAQVRDINETIEVIAVKQVDSGYGQFSEGIDISQDIDNYDVASDLSRETLRLPQALSKPRIIDKTIKELEEANKSKLRPWQDQPWLSGLLGIVFDDNQQYRLNGYILNYDTKYGLTYVRE
ncbi:CRISPR-associated helicase Cas3' [Aerococcaceae bacterium WGS1372]